MCHPWCEETYNVKIAPIVLLLFITKKVQGTGKTDITLS